MKNISAAGEDIQLKPAKDYYLIDALYLSEIKKGIDLDQDKNCLEEKIQNEVFPYTHAPFARIYANNNLISVSSIKKADDIDYEMGDFQYFSSDTGIVLLIEKSLFPYFIAHFDYNELVESSDFIINKEYWGNLVSKIEDDLVGIIIAPGIGSGYDFEGSGFYQIDVE
jgi:hypothetical protein